MTTTDSPTSQTQSQPVPDAASAAPAAAAPVKVEIPDPKPVEAKPAEAVPEVKPAEAAKPVEAKADAPAAPIIPDTYTITPPKGVTLDPAMTAALTPAFKAAGLTQAQVDGIAKTFLELQAAAPARMLARDLEITMKDPVLGQMNWGRTQGDVNEALAAFTTPEFRSKLERWGIANDAEFVRVFASIGKAMRGDTSVRGQPSSAEPESRADRMYGRSQKVN